MGTSSGWSLAAGGGDGGSVEADEEAGERGRAGRAGAGARDLSEKGRRGGEDGGVEKSPDWRRAVEGVGLRGMLRRTVARTRRGERGGTGLSRMAGQADDRIVCVLAHFLFAARCQSVARARQNSHPLLFASVATRTRVRIIATCTRLRAFLNSPARCACGRTCVGMEIFNLNSGFTLTEFCKDFSKILQ